MENRVLIVEDNPTNLKILLLTLEEKNYEIAWASDGNSAWNLLHRSAKPFDAIILDWMMPTLNGLDLLKKLKSDSRYQHIPVIMQSAKAQDADIEQGLNAGAFRYLTKPFTEEELLLVLDLAIKQSQPLFTAEVKI